MSTSTPPLSVVLDTHASPAAALQEVPIRAVTLTDTFWAPRGRVNRETTLPSQFQHLEETGALDNFRRTSGKKDVAFRGPHFSDSDLYKWLEAASWALASGEDANLLALVDLAIDDIAAAQQSDGYLDTYFMFDRAEQRWTTINLEFNFMHELYCAGHLFQAAVAHHRATGSAKLLDVATRLADLICDVFGPGEGQRQGVDGHPEIEMPLVELYRSTGNRRYLDAAQHFVDSRLGMGRINGAVYPFKHFRDYDRMEGHAVCGVYLAAGVTDLYAETGEAALKETLDRLWDNMTGAQMYLTGGIGPRWDNEAFGADYELPARAYAETCASIGNLMWNARMLTLAPDAKYADLIERILFNGFLSGVSLSGTEYFYQNPLSDDGRHRRQMWFGCACCPPNVARLLAQLPGYFYSTSQDGGVYVHLYAESRAELTLPGGREVALTQTANYPWDGKIRLEIGTGGRFALHLRVPGWAGGAELFVNGLAQPAPLPGTYAAIDADWNPGDVVELMLPMPTRLVTANPRASALRGQTALIRGPLVYCFEQADNPGVDLNGLRISTDADFQPNFAADLLGGITLLTGLALTTPPCALYGNGNASANDAPVRVTAVPYYAWANREPGAMTVWVATE